MASVDRVDEVQQGMSTGGKHIVLTTFGSFGDLHPYLAIALELQARGYRATIATCAVYREKVESEGVGFHAVRPDLTDLEADGDLMSKIMDVRYGSEFVIRKAVLPYVRSAYDDLSSILPSADLVVTHILSFAAHLWIEKNPRPWVSTTLQPSSLFSIYDPPVLAPAPGLTKFRWLGPLLYRPLFGMIRKEIARWMAPMQDIRRDIGLPSTDRDPFFEGQYSPECNLALFSQVLAEPQPDWPANTVQTGFPFYDKLNNAAEIPAELTAFLDAGEPPIVFTLGSAAVNDAGDFYVDSAKAASTLGRRAVLLTGRDERNVPANLPKTILACPYAPHSEIFPRACAVVHQGGIGTTGQALRGGRPQLVVPFGHDQPDNADRVVQLGLGRTVPRAKYNAATAERQLHKLLMDGYAAFRAKRIAEQVGREHGASTAVDAIESVLGCGPVASVGKRMSDPV